MQPVHHTPQRADRRLAWIIGRVAPPLATLLEVAAKRHDLEVCEIRNRFSTAASTARMVFVAAARHEGHSFLSIALCLGEATDAPVRRIWDEWVQLQRDRAADVAAEALSVRVCARDLDERRRPHVVLPFRRYGR